MLRCQLPFPRRSWGGGSSREAVEMICKLQDRSPRAGINQLPRHLPRLFGAVEPSYGLV
jgi:hypothetical protein